MCARKKEEKKKEQPEVVYIENKAMNNSKKKSTLIFFYVADRCSTCCRLNIHCNTCEVKFVETSFNVEFCKLVLVHYTQHTHDFCLMSVACCFRNLTLEICFKGDCGV